MDETAIAEDERVSRYQRWVHLRFSIVGPLLAAPPERGELRAQLETWAAKQWLHPVTRQPVRFGVSTIQRWYYTARTERRDPVGVLRRKIRSDAGQQPAVNAELARLLEEEFGTGADLSEHSAILKDETLCIRCANCAQRCPTGAITMERFSFTESWQ